MQSVSDTPRVTTVWLKWPISFYSGKDLCTEGEFQLLLYSTRAELPTLPIDGCHKGLALHHPLNHVTVTIMVTNAIVKVTSHSLQCNYMTLKSERNLSLDLKESAAAD